jgi:hypothetical protein
VRPPALENILVTLLEIRAKVKNGLPRQAVLRIFNNESGHTGMKIYFGFTVAGDRSSVEAARRMVDLLEAMGHGSTNGHLVSDDAARMDRSLARREVYERDMEWLRQCDIFIAEVSGSSFGLGYETGKCGQVDFSMALLEEWNDTIMAST